MINKFGFTKNRVGYSTLFSTLKNLQTTDFIITRIGN